MMDALLELDAQSILMFSTDVGTLMNPIAETNFTPAKTRPPEKPIGDRVGNATT